MDDPITDDDALEALEASPSADYMLRTTQQIIVHQSAMADQKASVVLGSSFVVASIVFGDISTSSELTLISTLLLATSTLSGILAALALSPKLSFSKDAATQPLFFGSIAHMDIDDYQALMKGILPDTERIHETVVADIHAGSSVLLDSKFRPLQLSYMVLVLGMVVTLVAALAV
ncbi:MAG: Pycsar system effector family protein [Actinomycetota bacterium]